MRLSVTAGTATGKPASSTPSRPMFAPCSPAWVTVPQTTSSISGGIGAGAGHDAFQRMRKQGIGPRLAECAAALPERRADGGEDDGNGHAEQRTRARAIMR